MANKSATDGSPGDLLTTIEVARIARVTRPTVCKWANDGSLPPVIRLPGGGLRFRRSDVEALLTPASPAEPAEAAS